MYLRGDLPPILPGAPDSFWETTAAPWRPEASEAGEEKSYWEGPLLCHWSDGNFDPWLPPALWAMLWSKAKSHRGFSAHESPYSRLSTRSALSLLLFLPAGLAANQLCVGENTFILIQPSSISLHPCAGYLLLHRSGLLCSAPYMCDLWGKTLIKEKQGQFIAFCGGEASTKNRATNLVNGDCFVNVFWIVSLSFPASFSLPSFLSYKVP